MSIHRTKEGTTIPLNEMSNKHLINTITVHFNSPDYSRRVIAIPYIEELLARAKVQEEYEQEAAIHPCDLGSYGVYKMDN